MKVKEFLAILLFGAMLGVASLVILSSATEHEKITVERWDDERCLVLINNGEEQAPAEPPFDCDKIPEKYPQANYREL